MKAPRARLTTSWDDGHPQDLRIAELLARYSIPATFYVPAASQFERLADGPLRNLGEAFELGAHTLRHLRLTTLPPEQAATEIARSKDFIEQLTGRPCRVFAPPGGRYTRTHLQAAAAAGLSGWRTVELLSLAAPVAVDGVAVMGTTLQVYRHGLPGYFRNALRRARPGRLLTWLRHGGMGGLDGLFESLLDHAIGQRRTVHLWGHGWEIEEQGDWPLLKRMLAAIDARRGELELVTNGQLCQEVCSHATARTPA